MVNRERSYPYTLVRISRTTTPTLKILNHSFVLNKLRAEKLLYLLKKRYVLVRASRTTTPTLKILNHSFVLNKFRAEKLLYLLKKRYALVRVSRTTTHPLKTFKTFICPR